MIFPNIMLRITMIFKRRCHSLDKNYHKMSFKLFIRKDSGDTENDC
jgi:hypothetical protein